MTQNIKKALNPRDHFILDATANSSWVPKKPVDLLLPYIDEKSEEENNDIKVRKRKAKEIFDGYGKIIEKTKEIKEEIAARCKNVAITLDPSRSLRVIEAVQRVFGGDGRQITFQMYQRCIEELAKSDPIPKPGEK